MQYTIVKAIHIDQMEQIVNDRLRSGWVQGGVSVTTAVHKGCGTIVYVQAMTKEVVCK